MGNFRFVRFQFRPPHLLRRRASASRKTKLKITAQPARTGWLWLPPQALVRLNEVSGISESLGTLKIHSAEKSSYEKISFTRNFCAHPRLEVLICLLHPGGRLGAGKSNLYQLNISLLLHVEGRKKSLTPLHLLNFTSLHRRRRYIKQPILLMCQIDIVIEKAVDVFVVFLV
jgi:hypothetical protein